MYHTVHLAMVTQKYLKPSNSLSGYVHVYGAVISQFTIVCNCVGKQGSWKWSIKYVVARSKGNSLKILILVATTQLLPSLVGKHASIGHKIIFVHLNFGTQKFYAQKFQHKNFPRKQTFMRLLEYHDMDQEIYPKNYLECTSRNQIVIRLVIWWVLFACEDVPAMCAYGRFCLCVRMSLSYVHVAGFVFVWGCFGDQYVWGWHGISVCNPTKAYLVTKLCRAIYEHLEFGVSGCVDNNSNPFLLDNLYPFCTNVYM